MEENKTTNIKQVTKQIRICSGKACVAESRVRVMDVVICYEHLRMTADEIVAAYPNITLSDVHTALAYYFDNLDEIRDDIRRNDELAGKFRARFPAKLKERLLRGAA